MAKDVIQILACCMYDLTIAVAVLQYVIIQYRTVIDHKDLDIAVQ